MERIMDIVDEGIKMFNYTDTSKIEAHYDACARMYKQSFVPETIEDIPVMLIGEDHGMTVNFFLIPISTAFYQSTTIAVER